MDELKCNALIRSCVPRLDEIIEDIEMKLLELRHLPTPPVACTLLDDDELTGILAYTHDLQQADGAKAGNIYFEENQAFRDPSIGGRAGLVQTWGIHLHYMRRGLSKLPSYEGVVCRVVDNQDTLEQYVEGRPIQWGSWTSTAKDESLPRAVAGTKGIVFRMKVTSGKQLSEISFFPNETEVLLSPDTRFFVSRKAYVEDGCTYVDLIEQQGSAYKF